MRKTCQIRKYLFWKKMRLDILAYVNDCMRCMEMKPDLRKIKMRDFHITADRPLQLASIDITGRLPRSNNYEYIISIIGVASKFLVLYALRKANTKEVFNRITDYSRHYGYPENILTNNGTQFTSHGWNRRFSTSTHQITILRAIQ